MFGYVCRRLDKPAILTLYDKLVRAVDPRHEQRQAAGRRLIGDERCHLVIRRKDKRIRSSVHPLYVPSYADELDSVADAVSLGQCLKARPIAVAHHEQMAFRRKS